MPVRGSLGTGSIPPLLPLAQRILINRIKARNMAEQTETAYAHECLRAELLGRPKPDRDTFAENYQPSNAEDQAEILSETLKEIDGGNASANHISGGLDELNAILQSTQKKLHNFKASCGTFTNLIKSKLSTRSPEVTEEEVPTANVTETELSRDELTANQGGSDLSKALDNHVDKLDSLLDKAENAQYSMKSQTSLMKRFLNN